MPSFSNISIIYNPKSTGKSKAMALQLQRTLQAELVHIEIDCIPTEFAGHAHDLAREIARGRDNPLIISASGDGGYNEVINGVMEAGNRRAVCAVLPTGNANDHSRTVQKQALPEAIVKGAVTRLDLIKATINPSGQKKATIRYAHSYAGLGLTPVIASELNRHKLNSFNELLLVFKTFNKYQPFTIRRNGKDLQLDSLLFGNINQMAKVFTLSSKNMPNDGKFEVVMFPSGSKTTLVKQVIKAALSSLDSVPHHRSYSFIAIERMPMQLDGEVITLPANSKVTIKSAHKAFATLI